MSSVINNEWQLLGFVALVLETGRMCYVNGGYDGEDFGSGIDDSCSRWFETWRGLREAHEVVEYIRDEMRGE